ncbi:MAG: hypothetical protein NZL87_07835, partial [Thermomicrobium sp.]|nr:hypothetical protein [Thermomicrobium sp.]
TDDKRQWRDHPDNPKAVWFRPMAYRTPIEQARWWATIHRKGPFSSAEMEEPRSVDKDPW